MLKKCRDYIPATGKLLYDITQSSGRWSHVRVVPAEKKRDK